VRTLEIHEASQHLFKLVGAIKSGSATEVIIAQDGVPVARLIPIAKKPEIRWGLAKDKFAVPSSIDELNSEVQALFKG
jgi:antitoxin (DNA-binding transcriptional repressor) of toxin-antitoxin stability system